MNPERIVSVDATKSVEALTDEVCALILSKLNK